MPISPFYEPSTARPLGFIKPELEELRRRTQPPHPVGPEQYPDGIPRVILVGAGVDMGLELKRGGTTVRTLRPTRKAEDIVHMLIPTHTEKAEDGTLRRTWFYINASGTPEPFLSDSQKYTAETAPIIQGHRTIQMQLLRGGKPLRAPTKVAPNIQVNVPLFEFLEWIPSTAATSEIEDAILDSGYLARCEREGVPESLQPAEATPRVLTATEAAIVIESARRLHRRTAPVVDRTLGSTAVPLSPQVAGAASFDLTSGASTVSDPTVLLPVAAGGPPVPAFERAVRPTRTLERVHSIASIQAADGGHAQPFNGGAVFCGGFGFAPKAAQVDVPVRASPPPAPPLEDMGWLDHEYDAGGFMRPLLYTPSPTSSISGSLLSEMDRFGFLPGRCANPAASAASSVSGSKRSRSVYSFSSSDDEDEDDLLLASPAKLARMMPKP